MVFLNLTVYIYEEVIIGGLLWLLSLQSKDVNFDEHFYNWLVPKCTFLKLLLY